MSKITKANEIKIPETVIGMVFGQAGSGKTTMALSMPKPLLIDTDRGVHRVQAEYRCDAVQVENYQDIIDVLQEDLSEYESIVVDTFGNLVKFMLDHFAQKDPALITKGGTYNIKIWGLVKNEFGRIAFEMRKLNKNLLYVAHQTDAGKDNNNYYIPKSQGSAIEDCIETLDFVGYCELVGKRRSIDFSPTDRHVGKNSIKLDQIIQVPILENHTENNFMVDYVINPSIERRKQAEQEHKKTDKQIADGRKLIGTDPNATLEMFKGMELSPYAKGILFKELCSSTELAFKDGAFS